MKIPAKYRLTLYVFAAMSIIVVFVLGTIAPEAASTGLDSVSKLIALAASALAAFNITPDT